MDVRCPSPGMAIVCDAAWRAQRRQPKMLVPGEHQVSSSFTTTWAFIFRDGLSPLVF